VGGGGSTISTLVRCLAVISGNGFTIYICMLLLPASVCLKGHHTHPSTPPSSTLPQHPLQHPLLPNTISPTIHPYPHCKENSIYVYLFWELRDLSPNFYIHVSVSDLYIPKNGPHISLQQNRQTDPGNI
jgi:hypothetical protein